MSGIFGYLAIHCIIASCSPKRRNGTFLLSLWVNFLDLSRHQFQCIEGHDHQRVELICWKSSHPPYQDHNVSIHGLGQLDITGLPMIPSPWHILDILVLVQSSVNQHESTLASFIMFHSISFQASGQHQKDGRNRNHPSQLGNCLTWAAAAAWPPNDNPTLLFRIGLFQVTHGKNSSANDISYQKASLVDRCCKFRTMNMLLNN